MKNDRHNESSGAPEKASPKSGWPKYVVGAALTYGVCVVLGGSMLSNDFATIIELGFIMGLFLFVLLGPAHLLLQILARWILNWLWHPRRPVEALVLNLPVLTILTILLIGAAIPPRPAALRESLKRHLGGSLPESVSVKGYSRSRGLSEGSYIFVFNVNARDLGSLTNGFVLDNSSAETNRLSWYKRKANELANGTASIDMPCAIYLFETNRGISRTRKALVVGSNGVDVVFCESFF
jgi:hypothetical protein